MQTTHERLNASMNERRLDLALSWEQVAERAHMTSTNLRAIRRGTTNPSELGARRLEDALRWQRGSIARILVDGGEPQPITDRPRTSRADYEAFIEQYADDHGISPEEAWEQIKARAAADRRTS